LKPFAKHFQSVAIATFHLKPVPAPAGGFLSFARPKERNQRKGRPAAACFLRSSHSPGLPKGASCPFGNVRHPCRTPDGLIPSKAPVLGAADGIGECVGWVE
jgi:hypothetical protein